MTEADFNDANMDGAILKGANMFGTNFSRTRNLPIKKSEVKTREPEFNCQFRRDRRFYHFQAFIVVFSLLNCLNKG
jgi:uncharacterized protein YjbI with pentapeptide repeats